MSYPLSASERATVNSAYQTFWDSTRYVLKSVALQGYYGLNNTLGSAAFNHTNRACAEMAMLYRHENLTSTQEGLLKNALGTLNTAIWSIFESYDSKIARVFEPDPEDDPRPEPWPEPEDPDGDMRRLMTAGIAMSRGGT